VAFETASRGKVVIGAEGSCDTTFSVGGLPAALCSAICSMV
jgi:hypothetical protein